MAHPVGLHDTSAELTALRAIWREDVISVKLGFVNEVSVQSVLGYHGRLDHILYQQNHQITDHFPRLRINIRKSHQTSAILYKSMR